MAAPAGFTQLVATRIQDATGVLCALGTLNILPTDGNDQPIGTTAGGVGGPIASEFAAGIPILAGVLDANGWAADTSLTRNQHISYRFVFRDAKGAAFLTWKGVQPSGATFNLDTYQPNLGTQSVLTVGPSLFDVAVKNGFQGTVSQYLATQVGAVVTIKGTSTTATADAPQTLLFPFGDSFPDPCSPTFRIDTEVGSGAVLAAPPVLLARAVQVKMATNATILCKITYAPAPLVVPPVHHWPANEGSGNVFIDHGSSPDNATSALSLVWLTGVPGIPGGVCANVDQRNLVCSTPAFFDIGQPFSITGFINVADTNQSNLIVSTLDGNTSANRGMTFFVTSRTLYLQLIRDVGASSLCVAHASGLSLANGTSYPVAVTCDGSGLAAGIRFALSGLPVTTPNVVDYDTLGGLSYNSGLPIHLAHNADNSSGSLAGTLAGVRVYNYVISADQIASDAGSL